MFFENKKEQKEDIKAQELSATESFMDRRIPYNMEYSNGVSS